MGRGAQAWIWGLWFITWVPGLTSGQKCVIGDASCLDERADPPLQNTLLRHFGDYHSQSNMLEDKIRVDTYKKAIDRKAADFDGAVCVDVGAGVGILSFFAAKAGANAVFAVEPSTAALVLKSIAEAPENEQLFGDRIHVVHGFVEDVPDTVSADIIVSEPFSYLLFSEYPILAAYLKARDRFLKPGGLMFPDTATLFVAPFSNEPILKFLVDRASFWANSSFYGINLGAAWRGAVDAEIAKPVVMTIDPAACVADAMSTVFDFKTLSPEAVKNVSIPFSFVVRQSGMVNGLAVWFDLGFPDGSTLSTSPWSQATHWQQVAMFLKYPLEASAGQRVSGELRLEAKDAMFAQFRMCLEEDGSRVRYLPFALNGAPVLKRSADAYILDNTYLQAKVGGMGYRLSKSNKDKDPNRIATWGSRIEGVDEGDGWLRIETTPMCKESAVMDIHHSQTRLH